MWLFGKPLKIFPQDHVSVLFAGDLWQVGNQNEVRIVRICRFSGNRKMDRLSHGRRRKQGSGWFSESFF